MRGRNRADRHYPAAKLAAMTNRIVLLTLLGLTAGTASAAAPAAMLNAFAENLRTLEGRFEQRVVDANGNALEPSTGTVALKAPRQFRFAYETPFPQLIVADGNNLWIHDEDLDQVTVRPQVHDEAESPLTVLVDPDELARAYEAKSLPTADGLAWMAIAPKSGEAAFKRAELGFADGELKRLVIFDQIGQVNTLSFSDWRRNTALDPALFAFVPPAGVDVVGEPVEPAEVTPLRR